MPDPGRSGQQERRIEIALHADPRAQAAPRLPEIDTPVQADHGAPGLPHQFQQPRRSRPEVDHRNPRRDSGDDAAHVRQDSPLVVLGGQASDPAVEELHGVRAGGDLAVEVPDRQDGELLHQRVPGGRLAVHQPLRLEEVLRGMPFDQIGRHRKGPAGEADQGHPAGQRLPGQPHGLKDEGDALQRIHHRQAVHVRRGAHRVADHRPFAPDELQSHAQRLCQEQDVGENDRRIDPEAVHRQHRHLGCGLGRLAEVEEAEPFADRPVFGEVAAGLPHQPRRRVLGRLAPAGAEKDVAGPSAGLGMAGGTRGIAPNAPAPLRRLIGGRRNHGLYLNPIPRARQRFRVGQTPCLSRAGRKREGPGSPAPPPTIGCALVGRVSAPSR